MANYQKLAAGSCIMTCGKTRMIAARMRSNFEMVYLLGRTVRLRKTTQFGGRGQLAAKRG